MTSIMTAHDQPDAAQKIRALIQSLQQDDRLRAIEQLVVLSLQLGAAPKPLSAPGLQAVSQEAVKTVIRKLNEVVGRQRNAAARLAAKNPQSVAPVIEHNTAQLEAVVDALVALCEHGGVLVVQD
jgi:hypothetical protein